MTQKVCNMCRARRDKPAYTSTCGRCATEHCDHMRCGCGPAPVLLKSRKEAPSYPVTLRCPCGRDMAPVTVAGEVLVTGTRRCSCGIAAGFQLRLDGHSVAGRPLYSLLSVTVSS